MPSYEFLCTDCDGYSCHELPIDERDTPQTCPQCQSVQTKRVFRSFPSFQLRGSGWAGKRTSSTTITKDDQVMRRIETASATDEDIAYVQNSGSASMMQRMQKKTNELLQEKKHLDRMYGEGAWDGKNSKGELTKIIDAKPVAGSII